MFFWSQTSEYSTNREKSIIRREKKFYIKIIKKPKSYIVKGAYDPVSVMSKIGHFNTKKKHKE